MGFWKDGRYDFVALLLVDILSSLPFEFFGFCVVCKTRGDHRRWCLLVYSGGGVCLFMVLLGFV